ncbi:MAG: glutamyl-tRNA amidotransferase [Cyanophyceae cyanobacterium]
MSESNPIYLAVNGTLMRGLALNGNLQAVGARFVREAQTAPCYRLWSIADRYPAMQQVETGGAAIALEIWSISPAGLTAVLLQEPPGLCIGKVRLEDGAVVLGVLGEAVCCAQGTEITQYGGWRSYTSVSSQTTSRR